MIAAPLVGAICHPGASRQGLHSCSPARSAASRTGLPRARTARPTTSITSTSPTMAGSSAPTCSPSSSSSRATRPPRPGASTSGTRSAPASSRRCARSRSGRPSRRRSAARSCACSPASSRSTAARRARSSRTCWPRAAGQTSAVRSLPSRYPVPHLCLTRDGPATRLRLRAQVVRLRGGMWRVPRLGPPGPGQVHADLRRHPRRDGGARPVRRPSRRAGHADHFFRRRRCHFLALHENRRQPASMTGLRTSHRRSLAPVTSDAALPRPEGHRLRDRGVPTRRPRPHGARRQGAGDAPHRRGPARPRQAGLGRAPHGVRLARRRARDGHRRGGARGQRGVPPRSEHNRCVQHTSEDAPCARGRCGAPSVAIGRQ